MAARRYYTATMFSASTQRAPCRSTPLCPRSPLSLGLAILTSLLPAPLYAEDTKQEVDSASPEGVAQSPASTGQIVDTEELAKLASDDIHLILIREPGVQIGDQESLGLLPNIGLRGTSPRHSSKMALTEDGVLLGPAPYSAPVAGYLPLVTRLQTVEVHKGGATLLYGPRSLGGALNLVTTDIPKLGWGGYADVAVGEYGYEKVHARLGYGTLQTGFLLEVAHVGAEGFKQLDGGGSTGFDKNEIMAKWRIGSAPGASVSQSLETKITLGVEQSDESYLGLTGDDFSDSPNRRYAASSLDEMHGQRGQAELSYTVSPSEDLKVRFTAYRQQFTRDWRQLDSLGGANLSDVLKNPDSGNNQIYYGLLTGQSNSTSKDERLHLAEQTRWYLSEGLQARTEARFTTGSVKHHLESGVRYHYDEVNRHHLQRSYEMVGATEDLVGHLERSDAPASEAARNRGQSHALSLHAVDSVSFEALTLTPGLRAEMVWTEYNDTLSPEGDNTRFQAALLPGAGVHLAVTETLGLLGGVYRGFAPVAPQWHDENAQLEEAEAESNTSWELGSRYTSSLFHGQLVGYFVNYQNLTAHCSLSLGCPSEQIGRQYDGGEVQLWGLESLLEKSWQLGSLTLPARATYALSMSSFRTDFASDNPEWGDVESGDSLPYLPTHQATLGAGLEKKQRWGLDANLTFVSQARQEAGSKPIAEDAHTDAYAVLGLGARIRAVRHLWFYANVENLFNSHHLVSSRPYGARPGTPRWLQVGFRVQQ